MGTGLALKEDSLPLAWTAEYLTLRERTLRSAVADPVLLERFATGAPLPPAYGQGLDERLVELPWVLSHLPPGYALTLDAGSSLNHALMLDQPALAEKRLHIITLVPEKECFWDRGISYVYDDLRALPFRDALYDVVVSVSTLEHVGCDNAFYGAPDAARSIDDFQDAVRELSRVLRPGGLFLLTVPYGVHQYHGAFQQFDRRRLSMAVEAFGPRRFASEQFYRYTAAGWQQAPDADCADAKYVGWVAELMRMGRWNAGQQHEPDFAAAARAVACVRLVRD